jgi:hypothetical protein
MSVFQGVPRRLQATVTAGVIGAAGLSILAAAPASAAPTVRALYHMEDGGTTLADSSGNGNNGSLRKVTTGQPGVSGFAYRFNGRNSVATVPSSPSLNPGTATFTLAASFKMKVKRAVDMDVVRKGVHDTPGGDYKIDVTGRGSKAIVRCVVIGSRGSGGVVSGPDINDGAWHRVSCTKKSNRLTFVVDGRVVGSQRVRIGRVDNDVALTIGGKPARIGDYYKGLVDEVSLTIG